LVSNFKANGPGRKKKKKKNKMRTSKPKENSESKHTPCLRLRPGTAQGVERGDARDKKTHKPIGPQKNITHNDKNS